MSAFNLATNLQIAENMAQLSRGAEAGDDTDVALKALLWEGDAKGEEDNDEPNPVTLLMPYLQQYGMIPSSSTADEVTVQTCASYASDGIFV